MSVTQMLHVRVDTELKAQATEALAAMGLSVSEAVRVFLTRVVTDQALPFPLKAPNDKTRAAMNEARTIDLTRFANSDEMFDGLGQEGR